MRILFISTLYPPNVVGGAERVVQAVAEELVTRGNECHVITISRKGRKLKRNLNGVYVHELPLRNLYHPFKTKAPTLFGRAFWHAIDSFNPWMGTAVGTVVDEICPDIVNTHNIAGFSVASWASVKKRGLPLVHTLHDQYLLCPRTTMFGAGHNCGTQCSMCRLYGLPRVGRSNLPDLVVGVSEFILEHHQKFACFDGVPVKLIYNAYERPTDCVTFAKEKQTSRKKLRFGYLGRLHESKGINCLLDAWRRLQPGLAELWIAGTGEESYVTALHEDMENRADVRWLGFVRPETFLAEVDVTVIPSLWNDTAPLAALESLAWGLPIIASNRGGLPELVKPNVGWLFDPALPDDLTTILRNCIIQRELIEQKSHEATARASNFTAELQIKGYLDAYEFAMAQVCR